MINITRFIFGTTGSAEASRSPLSTVTPRIPPLPSHQIIGPILPSNSLQIPNTNLNPLIRSQKIFVKIACTKNNCQRDQSSVPSGYIASKDAHNKTTPVIGIMMHVGDYA